MRNFLALIVLTFSSIAIANDISVLENLPFGIELGKTKNSEVENYSVCQSKIKITESYFRCEQYSTVNGNVLLFSSQNEIITRIEFSPKSRLPKDWKVLNLSFYQLFDYVLKSPGTQTNEFYFKLYNSEAENIEKNKLEDENHSQNYSNVVSFDLKNLHYEFKFEIQASNPQEWGLGRIIITESY